MAGYAKTQRENLMPAINAPFTPSGATQSSAVTTSNTQATLPVNSGQVRFYNEGPNVARVRWGVGAQTATATDTPLAPGAIEVLTKPPEAVNLAYICTTGTATVHATAGEGA